ncbi:helix-turn-helix domain-containing protein [Kitasatospora sp. NPDC050463]|uniref:helix-turn-helix domain-containing protein n=1 Tax=Kitasatospora sp. NPDC050463 TaxID=3155786 RepID=UPI0033FD142E
MGRPKKAVAPGAVAEDLARFLQELSARSGKTYDAMARVCGVSAATLCRADSGERRPRLEVVRAYVEACGAGSSDLRKAERLWEGTPSQVSLSGVRWVEPDAVCEVHQLGELMRAARALSGKSLRLVEERARALGLVLSRSTLGDAMRPGAVPTETVFCVFMRVIGDFDGSPAAGYGPEVWEEVWRRVQPGRRPRVRAGTVGGSSRKASPVRGPSAASPVPAAGSARGGQGGRRPRARAWVRPGPVKEFKDRLYQLYLGAGVPSLDDIATAVLLNDSLEAAPGRDRVNRLLWSAELGLQQDAVAVAGILAVMAGLDPASAAEQARELWVQAAAARPYGCAVGEADPLALGVREAFVLPRGGRALPALVPYVRRQHDQAIEAVVGRAVAGRSGMVIVRGPQAAGKTRSCWEALRGIPAGWRLWHPADPFDGTQVVQGLAQAGPRTVVWLDRVERYLDPVQYRGAGTVQAELGNVLHDSRRAPVLVIGTVSATAGVLTRSGGLTPGADTVVRTLIEDAVVDVSPRFTKAELARLADLADLDERLATARDNARGAVPKFLATSRKAYPILAPESFHTAVEQGDTDTLFMGGALLQESGRLEEAAAWYQRAAEAGDSQAIEPAATLLTESGEPQEAISWLRTLAEAGDPDAAVAAARRLLGTGQDNEAIRVYQQAALASGSSRALRAAAALMRRSGRAQEAVSWLRDCAAGGKPVALQEAADLLWEMGDTTRALRFYADAGSAGEPGAWREAAGRLQTLGRGDEAVIMYRAAVRHGDRQSVLPLADLLVELGRRREALEIYLEEAEKQRKPKEQNPDLGALWRVANLYRSSGQPDEALSWLQEAADRGDVAAFMQIGLVLRDKCEQDERFLDEAVAAFTKAAAAGEWHAYRESVWLLRKHRGLKAAVAWLHRRIEDKDPRAVREMADLLREAGMPEQALVWYLRAAEQGSEYSAKYALRLQSRLLACEENERPGREASAAIEAAEATEGL